MPDPKNLPYLLRLLDDDSQLVKQAVLQELAAFGASLEEELSQLPKPPDANQRQLLQNLLKGYTRSWLEKAWPHWFRFKDDKKKLEMAHTLLADFQNGSNHPVKLKTLLDQLAKEFAAQNPKDVRQLAEFLFHAKGLKGVPESDYFNPLNSNLVYVIEKKRGIPISLVCIYMLVGYRAGLDIEGCNFPGHFLAKTVVGGKTVLVDCFNGGEFVDEKRLVEMNPEIAETIQEIIHTETSAEALMNRVLRNLIRAYQETDNLANSHLMLELLKMLERETTPLIYGSDSYLH
ncbi:MAG: transglutaminase-like domain-containing protein [Candidatus Omnitrophota bacterium]